jgi:hypothetical protein
MTLTFEATDVSCDDAIDGEILRASFDTLPASHDEEERRTPYVEIMRNLEFPALRQSNGMTVGITTVPQTSPRSP